VNTKKYTKGGALKPVPSEKKGLSKLPTEVRNKMGYMMGGGKMGMMYQNGGKQDPPRKKITDVIDRNGRPISPMRREVEAMFAKFKGEAYPGQAAKTEKTFMANARAQEAINLNEMRNALKSEGPASVAKFDQELKAKGYKVVQKPVKKMMGGGKMEYAMGGMMGKKIERLENREKSLVARGSKAVDEGRERKADRLLGRAARVENRLIKAKESAPVKKMMGGGKLDMMYAKGGKMDVHDPKGLAHVGSKGAKAPLSTPYNKTKDNNSYISNDVDMSPAIKKQMMALRQAMMYFTGVSPKNK